MAISKFQRGSAVFNCNCCGRGTRATGVQSVGARVCPQCYDLAGYENMKLDDGKLSEQDMSNCTELRDSCIKHGGDAARLAKEFETIFG